MKAQNDAFPLVGGVPSGRIELPTPALGEGGNNSSQGTALTCDGTTSTVEPKVSREHVTNTARDVSRLDLDRIAARFWPKVAKRPQPECWTWTAYRNPNGYGRFLVSSPAGWSLNAHRVSYLLTYRELPSPGMHLDHLCRNRACVNPEHLEVVTPAVNIRRGLTGEAASARGRAITHCRHGHEYSEENTRRDSRGCRHCRTCERAQGRDRRRAVRLAKKAAA